MKVCLLADILDGEQGVLAEILRARRALGQMGSRSAEDHEERRRGETWTCSAPVPKAPAAPREDDRVAVSRRPRHRLTTTREIRPATFALAQALAGALDLSESRVFDLALHSLLGSLPVETRAKIQRELVGGGS